MMPIFVAYLALAAIVILVSFWLGISGLAYELEKYGITSGDDGHLVHVEEDTEPPSAEFMACRKEAVVEAFQVNSGLFPPWVMAENIDVQILPEMKIVVHRGSLPDVIATGTDYLVCSETDSICRVSEKDYLRDYIPIHVADAAKEGEQ